MTPRRRASSAACMQTGRTATREVVAAGIAGSPEALTLALGDVFQQVLGRAPSDTEQTTYRHQLVAGIPLSSIAASLAGTQEYFDAHGSNNEGFVQGLYQSLLYR